MEHVHAHAKLFYTQGQVEPRIEDESPDARELPCEPKHWSAPTDRGTVTVTMWYLQGSSGGNYQSLASGSFLAPFEGNEWRSLVSENLFNNLDNRARRT